MLNLCIFKNPTRLLGYTNTIYFHWTCLDLETNISERSSKYALGKNEMTGVTGRPRQPGRPRQAQARPRQHGSRKAGWQTGRQEACCGSLAVLGTVQANLISL